MNQHIVIVIIAITLIKLCVCNIFLTLIPLAVEGKPTPSLPNFGNAYHVKGKTCLGLQIKPLS